MVTELVTELVTSGANNTRGDRDGSIFIVVTGVALSHFQFGDKSGESANRSVTMIFFVCVFANHYDFCAQVMTTHHQASIPPETPPLPAVVKKKKDDKPTLDSLLKLHELKILTKWQLEQQLRKYYPEFLPTPPENDLLQTPPVAPTNKRMQAPPLPQKNKSQKRKSAKTKRQLITPLAAAPSPPPPSPPTPTTPTTPKPKQTRRKKKRKGKDKKKRPGKSHSPKTSQIRVLVRNTVRRRFLMECINPNSPLWYATNCGRKRNELNKLLFGRAASDLCTRLYNENPGPLHHVNNAKLLSIIRWQVSTFIFYFLAHFLFFCSLIY